MNGFIGTIILLRVRLRVEKLMTGCTQNERPLLPADDYPPPSRLPLGIFVHMAKTSRSGHEGEMPVVSQGIMNYSMHARNTIDHHLHASQACDFSNRSVPYYRLRSSCLQSKPS